MVHFKRLRLRQHPEFFAKAKRSTSKTLVWFFLPLTEKNVELTIRVRKTNAINAVKKNYLRRKIKEAIKFQLKDSNKGLQLMVVTRKECGILNPAQVLRDINSYFSSKKQ